MAYTDWQHYQQATAETFRRLGCDAEVDYTAQGARGRHDVDVFATFLRSGIRCTWIVECKLWSSRVPKEKVMALKAIVEDLGADRGIIVSEVGFQSGAQEAARDSNITLVTSLEQFEKTALAASTETPLLLDSSEAGPPIYKFPSRDGPMDLVVYGNLVITASWSGCNIAIVDAVRKTVLRTIDLDKYEAKSPHTGKREVRTYPPGSLAVADGRLFVAQVFSEFIVVIDLETQAIVKRIAVPGGGQGQLATSVDERTVYFASNAVSQFCAIDTATYSVKSFPYPHGGRGSLTVLPHPNGRRLYVAIQRGGAIAGRPYPHANSYLAMFDLERRIYVGNYQLAEIVDGRADDATPIALTLDEKAGRLFVGMFQSKRGIVVVDPDSLAWKRDIRFKNSPRNKHFPWVDAISQAIADDLLLSVNRNNRELVVLDRIQLTERKSLFLGDLPDGPRAVAVWQNQAIVTYPGRNGLIFLSLAEFSSS